MEHSHRVTDFVPRRVLPFVLYAAVSGLLIASCMVLHGGLPQWLPGISQPRLAAFDLESSGSLAVWLSTMLLAQAAATCWLIYSIRRRKPDDYHGRYRIWLWLAIVVGLMSISTTANLHLAFQTVIVRLSGWHTSINAAAIWLGSWALILGAIGGRAVVAAWRSRAASTLFILTAILWMVAAVAEMGWLPLDAELTALVRQGCKMTGQLTFLLGLGWYARHAILEEQGLLPVRAAEAAKPAKVKPAKIEKAGATTKVDAAHKELHGEKRSDLHPHAPGKTAPLDTGDDDEEQSYDDEDDDRGDRKLSKADRKRLRREKIDQRRAGLR